MGFEHGPSRDVSAKKETILEVQDLEDIGDFEYLLSIMEEQNAEGVTQSLDYEDAMIYRDSVESFREHVAEEGPINELFNDVIFDFDGVLYDSTYSAYRTLELMLEKYADKRVPFPHTLEDVANSYQAPFKNFYLRFGITLDTPEKLATFKVGYREAMAQVDAEHHTPAKIYPEVRDVLKKLEAAKANNPGLKIHIISAGAKKYINDVLEAEGLSDFFDQVHPECHDKTAMITSIADAAEAPDRTVMIGDLPSDIKDAKLVEGEGNEVKTIAVARGKKERKRLATYLPDYIVSDLEELFDLKSHSKSLAETELT